MTKFISRVFHSLWPLLFQFRAGSGIVARVFTAVAFLLIFENCAPSSGDNPLTDPYVTTACAGVSCTQDVTTAGFMSPVSGILLDSSASVSNGSCNSANCFDVGGYCETGGFPSTYFSYQWVLPSGTLPVVQTTASCDSNGRFRVLIKVPTSGFNNSVTNEVKLTMTVLDAYGNVQSNPSGAASWTYQVTTRTN